MLVQMVIQNIIYIKLNKNFIFVYDWECGRLNTLYFDIFHYIVNEDIVANIKNKELIIDDILTYNKYLDEFEARNNIKNNLRIQMFILYLYEEIYDFTINRGVDKNNDGLVKNYIEILNMVLQRN